MRGGGANANLSNTNILFLLTSSSCLQPDQLGRKWRYSIKWSQTGTSRSRKSLVTVTSKPRSRVESQLVSANVWTVPADGFPLQQRVPVAVFAQVQLGSSPVINASVFLDVEVENENGTTFALLPISMRDNGRGGNEHSNNSPAKL